MTNATFHSAIYTRLLHAAAPLCSSLLLLLLPDDAVPADDVLVNWTTFRALLAAIKHNCHHDVL
jgi:hypothetical protein